MDRQGWIVIILCVIGLIAWQIYYAPRMAPPPPAETREEPAAPGAVEDPGAQAAAPEGPRETTDEEPLIQEADQDPVTAQKTAEQQLPEARIVTLEDELSIYNFTTHGGGLESVVLKHHTTEGGQSIIMNEFGRLPIGMLDTVAEPMTPPIYEVAEQDDANIVFEAETPAGITIRKTFHLATADNDNDNQDEPAEAEAAGGDEDNALLPAMEDPGDYLLHLKVEFINTRDVAQIYPSYYLHFGEEEAIYESDPEQYTTFQWLSGKGHKSIHTRWFDGSKVPLLGIPLRDPADVYEKSFEEIHWAAVSNQFFSILLNPIGLEPEELWATRSVAEPEGLTEEELEKRRTIYAMHGALKLPAVQLLADSTTTHAFEFYIGPKEYGRLNRLEDDQDEILNFGIFAPISVILLNSLNFFHAIFERVGLPFGFALGIIAITVILKILLWPLQTKAMVSMRNMSEQMKIVNPKMEEIRGKYKDNPQKQNEEMMKLYRQYKINPLGGCLPSLIQLPIFLGFFYMLRTAVELRNAEFLWVTDLSRPDTVATIAGFIPINPLPILMTISMVFYMKIQPKTGNPMQQRMMMFMPVIFFVICYNFASALALYWTTQNILSVVQYFMTKELRAPRDTPEAGGEPAKASPTPDRPGGGGGMKQAKGRTVSSGPPKKSSSKGMPKPRKK